MLINICILLLLWPYLAWLQPALSKMGKWGSVSISGGELTETVHLQRVIMITKAVGQMSLQSGEMQGCISQIY